MQFVNSPFDGLRSFPVTHCLFVVEADTGDPAIRVTAPCGCLVYMDRDYEKAMVTGCCDDHQHHHQTLDMEQQADFILDATPHRIKKHFPNWHALHVRNFPFYVD